MTDDIKAGRFISLALRHHPEAAGITLDEHGYADTDELIKGVSRKFPGFTGEDLDRIVRENNKQRYSYNEDKTKIRANQGHSVTYVDVELERKTPPAVLFHGTAETSLPSIMKEGLKPMSRLYVHLSPDAETAEKVGKRHGKPVILKINTEKMSQDGFEFFISANGVWQIKAVPAEYIERI
ncbi:MAG: RNA 2'-phosphotransferase [Huintestinicola sp.]|uniref:RNA 2'-phosphotransferase n=1 Tax=Huintestinicola sp. TaxID=2981661 RepID=UPI003F09F37A